MNKITYFFTALLLSLPLSAASEALYNVEILEVEVRYSSGGYVLARLDKSFTTCSEGNYIKLNMDDSALSNAAYTAMLSAKVTDTKVDLLSSSTCEHFNVLERIKLREI